MEIINVTLPSVNIRGTIYIFGLSGKTIGTCSSEDVIGRVYDSRIHNAAMLIEWDQWAIAEAKKITRAVWHTENTSDWDKKIDVLVGSWRLSRRDRCKCNTRGRQVDWQLNSSDWESAIQRMEYQGINKSRCARQTKWERWVNTVVKNAERRRGSSVRSFRRCGSNSTEDKSPAQ